MEQLQKSDTRSVEMIPDFSGEYVKWIQPINETMQGLTTPTPPTHERREVFYTNNVRLKKYISKHSSERPGKETQ